MNDILLSRHCYKNDANLEKCSKSNKYWAILGMNKYVRDQLILTIHYANMFL